MIMRGDTMDAGELTPEQPSCWPLRHDSAASLLPMPASCTEQAPSSLPLPPAGAVAYLKDVRNAISAARLVMEHTQHTILAGGAATQFAQQMGLALQTLNTERSTQAWQQRCVAAGAWVGTVVAAAACSKSPSRMGKKAQHLRGAMPSF